MDFRNLCSKIDVDAIRAKFPALPDVMTNMKLPKSMSKLKSRKIFQSSREDISAERRHSSSKYLGSVEDITLPPPSEFVDHTPHKISTISSLVDQPGRGRRGVGGAHGLGRGATMKRCNLEDQEEEGFYRSAGGIDDYCPSPLKASTARRSVSSKPISPPGSRSNMSPGHRSASEQSVKMSLTERVQRNCKNIFVKKTVVRQDNIQINEYVQRFEEDRRHQQRADELIDVDLDEDYDFEFKISRRKSEESFGISTPRESPVPAKGNNRKTLSEQSGDESGMEESPPPRKAGIAATRFSRVRKEPLSMSLDEDGDHINQSPIKRKAKEQDEEEEEDDDDLDIEDVNDELKKEPLQPIHPIESSLYKKLIQRKGTVKQTRSPEKQNKVKSVKKRLGDLKNASQEVTLSLSSGSPQGSPKVLQHRENLSPQKQKKAPEKLNTVKCIKKRLGDLKNASQELSISLSSGSPMGSPLIPKCKNPLSPQKENESPEKLSKLKSIKKRLGDLRNVSQESSGSPRVSPNVPKPQKSLRPQQAEQSTNPEKLQKSRSTKKRLADLRDVSQELSLSLSIDSPPASPTFPKTQKPLRSQKVEQPKTPEKLQKSRSTKKRLADLTGVSHEISLSLSSGSPLASPTATKPQKPLSPQKVKEPKTPEKHQKSRSIKKRLADLKGVSQELSISLSSGSPMASPNIPRPQKPLRPQKVEQPQTPDKLQNSRSLKKRLADLKGVSQELSISLSSGSPLGSPNIPKPQKALRRQEAEQPKTPEKLQKPKGVKKRLRDLKDASQEISLTFSIGSPQDSPKVPKPQKTFSPEKEAQIPEKLQKSRNIKKRLADLNGVSQELSLSLSDGSPLYSPKVPQHQKPLSSPELPNTTQKLHKSRSIKKHLGDLKYASQELSLSLSLSSGSPLGSPKVSKRKAPLSPRQSVEDEEVQMSPVVGDQKTEKSSGVIRQNYKRLQKSIKLPSRGSAAHSGAESETEETAAEAGKTKTTKSQQFAERLKRFRSVENVDKPAEDEPDETKSSGSPLHKITSKLQDWTKSFKRRHSVAPNTDDGMNSPNKAEKNVAIFIKKLQHMRSRKQAGNEDPDDDEEGGVTYKESFKSRAKLHLEKGVAAASQMPQMTMEKLKESKKYFRKKQDKEKEKEPKQPEKIGVKQDSEESALEDSDEEMQMAKSKAKVKPKSEDKTTSKVCRDRHYYSSDDEDDDEGEDAVEATRVTLEPYQQNVLVPLTRAAWTAKPILTDSGDDEDDDILPRVLIHQDNSNVFESTLIIAVTRPVARSQTISPYITELPPDYEEESPKASPSDSPKLSTPETKADNWIPNREMISNFSEVSKTLERTLSNDDSLQSFSSARQNSRNHSMDSSSEDSWIKDVDRDVSTAIGLTGLHDMEEPWKVKSGEPGTSDNKLYKTKSIDIFETHQKDGQELKIFEDFDDELKNTPIVRIENKRDLQDLRAATYESCDQDDSSESMDCADDDNSSRITKILKQPELEKTVPSQEILAKPTLTTQLYGNSRESLMGIQDRPQSTEDSGAEEDNEDSSSEEEGEKNDMDRPPSKAPSPPPPKEPLSMSLDEDGDHINQSPIKRKAKEQDEEEEEDDDDLDIEDVNDELKKEPLQPIHPIESSLYKKLIQRKGTVKQTRSPEKQNKVKSVKKRLGDLKNASQEVTLSLSSGSPQGSPKVLQHRENLSPQKQKKAPEKLNTVKCIKKRLGDLKNASQELSISLSSGSPMGSPLIPKCKNPLSPQKENESPEKLSKLKSIKKRLGDLRNVSQESSGSPRVSPNVPKPQKSLRPQQAEQSTNPEKLQKSRSTKKRLADLRDVSQELSLSLSIDSPPASPTFPKTQKPLRSQKVEQPKTPEKLQKSRSTKKRLADLTGVSHEISLSLSSGSPLASPTATKPQKPLSPQKVKEPKTPEKHQKSRSIKKRLADLKGVSQELSISLSSGSPMASPNIPRPQKPLRPQKVEQPQTPDKLQNSRSLKKRLADLKGVSQELSISLSSGSPLGSPNIPKPQKALRRQEAEQPKTPEKLQKPKGVKKRLRDLKDASQEISLTFSIGSPQDSPKVPKPQKTFSPEKEAQIPEKLQKSRNIKKRLADLNGVSQELSLSLSDGSPLYSPKVPQHQKPLSSPELPNTTQKLHKSRSIKKHLGDLKYASQELSLSLSLSSGSPLGSPKVSKRKAPLSPRQSVEDEEVQMSPVVGDQKTEKSSGVIRQNYKRLQKSIKLPSRGSAAHSGAESETEETAAEAGKTKTTKSQQFAERLKRFRSVENVDKPAEDEPDETKSSGSPLHKITSKLQDWTKSFKRRHSVAPNTDDGMNSPNKAEKNVAIFIKKLQHMRSRKQAGNEDPDDDEEGGVTYKESFKSRAKLHLEKGVAAASQMPQMTMEKLKESKKYFRKKQDKEKEKEPKQPEKIGVKQDSEESALEDSDEEMQMAKSKAKVKPKSEDKTTSKVCRDRHYYSSDDEDDDEGEDAVEATRVTLEPYQQNVLVPLTRAAWTAKPILTDSGDDEDDDILPRVLIHQDNSNVFESTLIIAVTRPVARSQTISPYITELPPDYEEESPKASPSDSPKLSTPETKADNWIPNREMISNFSEVSKTLERTLSNDDSLQSFSSARQNSRNHSMDSSSEDSWIKDVDRDVSTAIGLTGLHDMEEPWKVKSGEPGTSDNKLYKTKSIDIFETHQKDGQELKIFEDFDDELKNTPIVRIENKRDLQDLRAATYESCDQDDSSESMDCADDDNSSRITKILKQPELEKTVPSQEILAKPTLTTQLYGNSRESLMGIQDRPQSTEDSGAEEDNEDSSSEEEGEKNDMDRPPSKAPSPPPPVSPPPPLPQCQTSTKPPNSPPQPSQVTISANVEASSPPSEIPPQYKPPMPPNRQIDDPPKIPERAAATSKVARPLVKTASMRLAYSEQVNPDDVGKVNKLISRFEPNRRPRVILRKAYILQDSEDYSDHEPEAKIEEDIAETPKKTGENETIIQDVIDDNLNIRTKKPLLQRTVSIETAELIPVPPTATIKSHLETLQEPEAAEQIVAAGICTINNNKFEQQQELEAQELPVVSGAPTMTNKTETQPDLPHVDAPMVIKNREPEASAQQVVVSTPTMNNNIESLASDEPIVREGPRHQHLDEVPLNVNNNLESQQQLPIRATPPTKKNNLKPQAPEPPLVAASAIINDVKPLDPELSLEAPQSPINNNLEQQPEPESPGLVTYPKKINNNLELQIEAETSRLPNVSAPSTINKNLGIELELKASELPITINNNNPKPQLKPEQDSTESYRSSPPIIMNSQDLPITTTSSFNQNNNTSSNSLNQIDINANFSQPNSEYGSPMAFPSSLMGSTEVTPVVNRKEPAYLNNTLARSRRSVIGDDEAFDSFDSDEENSYYSLSSTSSSRYVVEM